MARPLPSFYLSFYVWWWPADRTFGNFKSQLHKFETLDIIQLLQALIIYLEFICSPKTFMLTQSLDALSRICKFLEISWTCLVSSSILGERLK